MSNVPLASEPTATSGSASSHQPHERSVTHASRSVWNSHRKACSSAAGAATTPSTGFAATAVEVAPAPS